MASTDPKDGRRSHCQDHGETASRLTRAGRTGTSPKEIIPGQTVWVVSLGKEATVMGPVDHKGRVKVQAGIFSVDIDASDIRSHRHGKNESKQKSVQKASPAKERLKSWDAVSPQIPDNTIDLRGHRVVEALEALEKSLDGLFARGLDSAFIIHGHGTGASKGSESMAESLSLHRGPTSGRAV